MAWPMASKLCQHFTSLCFDKINILINHNRQCGTSMVWINCEFIVSKCGADWFRPRHSDGARCSFIYFHWGHRSWHWKEKKWWWIWAKNNWINTSLCDIFNTRHMQLDVSHMTTLQSHHDITYMTSNDSRTTISLSRKTPQILLSRASYWPVLLQVP